MEAGSCLDERMALIKWNFFFLRYNMEAFFFQMINKTRGVHGHQGRRFLFISFFFKIQDCAIENNFR